jgi:FdhD protein
MQGPDVERPGLTVGVRVLALRGVKELADDVATEEPLEIRAICGSQTRTAAVTMRTPGNDFELACGFLYSEGVLRSHAELAGMSYCVDPAIDAAQRYNIVNVALASHAAPDLGRLERHFTMSSACGVCGKASIEALQTRAEPLEDGLRLDGAAVQEFPEKMRAAQRVFASTGGLHAAALFDASGNLLALREDVGRHNAVDKIVGWALMHDRLPLRGCALMVSGRASYELAQKSIVAGIPVLCAVSAPSSLAVSLANAFGLTLLGFVRQGRANVYTGWERIVPVAASKS